VSYVQILRRRSEVDDFQGEIRNIKPPNFDGNYYEDEDVYASQLGMTKYFQFHNYSSNV